MAKRDAASPQNSAKRQERPEVPAVFLGYPCKKSNSEKSSASDDEECAELLRKLEEDRKEQEGVFKEGARKTMKIIVEDYNFLDQMSDDPMVGLAQAFRGFLIYLGITGVVVEKIEEAIDNVTWLIETILVQERATRNAMTSEERALFFRTSDPALYGQPDERLYPHVTTILNAEDPIATYEALYGTLERLPPKVATRPYKTPSPKAARAAKEAEADAMQTEAIFDFRTEAETGVNRLEDLYGKGRYYGISQLQRQQLPGPGAVIDLSAFVVRMATRPKTYAAICTMVGAGVATYIHGPMKALATKIASLAGSSDFSSIGSGQAGQAAARRADLTAGIHDTMAPRYENWSSNTTVNKLLRAAVVREANAQQREARVDSFTARTNPPAVTTPGTEAILTVTDNLNEALMGMNSRAVEASGGEDNAHQVVAVLVGAAVVLMSTFTFYYKFLPARCRNYMNRNDPESSEAVDRRLKDVDNDIQLLEFILKERTGAAQNDMKVELSTLRQAFNDLRSTWNATIREAKSAQGSSKTDCEKSWEVSDQIGKLFAVEQSLAVRFVIKAYRGTRRDDLPTRSTFDIPLPLETLQKEYKEWLTFEAKYETHVQKAAKLLAPLPHEDRIPPTLKRMVRFMTRLWYRITEVGRPPTPAEIAPFAWIPKANANADERRDEKKMGLINVCKQVRQIVTAYDKAWAVNGFNRDTALDEERIRIYSAIVVNEDDFPVDDADPLKKWKDFYYKLDNNDPGALGAEPEPAPPFPDEPLASEAYPNCGAIDVVRNVDAELRGILPDGIVRQRCYDTVIFETLSRPTVVDQVLAELAAARLR